ncbi:DUF1116 domain-containing protein [Gluconobacter cerinus]|uniref:DUF1116 domain-containing protein n=1 Tax=Gluconobacter cerinus TaxID=38307 RepID=UPI001B8BA31E|nr:DUF1116 domain-containing protein [Gluconobacter cerinus]MBS1072494.1 DUF1116 domain-containing protein [Gluconobacter cerinus]MCW2266195.1 hypothetical protein [Gluconobacter cerinus]
MTSLIDKINVANEEAFSRLVSAKPVWVDVRPAIEVLPHMTRATILHAGPPIAWQDMCGPQKMGVVQAALHEGLTDTEAQAEALITAGEIIVAPCHDYGAVGGMAGITSASSPLAVVHDPVHGHYGYSQLFQGPAAGLLNRDDYNREARKRWTWLQTVLGPVLGAALRSTNGIPVKPMIARALEMGDECHNRNSAGSAVILNAIVLALYDTCKDRRLLQETLDYLKVNEQFSLCLSMAAGKAMADATKYIPYSTMVSAMCRNGVNFGIKVSGLGDQWFTAPANRIDGLYFSAEWSDNDAVPDIGDSSIMETIGLGGHVQAAAPVLQQFVNGSFARATTMVEEMQLITIGQSAEFKIPNMNFTGAPTGIDIRKVVQTSITPIIDTAIAHKKGGVIGAGQTRAPFDCFANALRAFGTQYRPD